MQNLNRGISLVLTVLLAVMLGGCKTNSSSSSSSSSGSPSSGGSASSSPSGTSSSMPAGGSYNPFPQSGAGLPGKSGGKPGEIGKKGDAGATQKSSSKSGGQSGDGSEDKTLSDALEEFERARNKGNANGQSSGTDGAQSAAIEETDFPLIMPPSGEAGDDLEQQEGIEGGLEGGGSAQTDGEKVAVLDRQLEESYGQFEGRILRERGYVRGKENARGSNVDIDPEGVIAGEQSAGGVEGSGAVVGENEAGGPITGSGAGSRPQGGDQREGDYQHQAATTHKPPADIPDGSDDDVVARQLREAAMRESDSELREKLWDEYRKYKNKSKNK